LVSNFYIDLYIGRIVGKSSGAKSVENTCEFTSYNGNCKESEGRLEQFRDLAGQVSILMLFLGRILGNFF